MITLAIVDDDPIVVQSLATILDAQPDMRVVATYTDPVEAAESLPALAPAVALLDIRMDGMDGIACARRILEKDPGCTIAFLTTFSDDEYIGEAMGISIGGYLIKQDVRALAPSIRRIAEGRLVLGEDVLERLEARPELASENAMPLEGAEPARADDRSAESGLATLTDRERSIASLVAKGLDNRAIAEELCLSTGTVRNNLSAILTKLHLENRTQLAAHFWRSRLEGLPKS